jgi:hypothetical protein
MKRIHGLCKHLLAVEAYEQKKEGMGKEPTILTSKDVQTRKQQEKKKRKEILASEEREAVYARIKLYVEQHTGCTAVHLISLFGEEPVQDMLRLGELYEHQGKIQLL